MYYNRTRELMKTLFLFPVFMFSLVFGIASVGAACEKGTAQTVPVLLIFLAISVFLLFLCVRFYIYSIRIAAMNSCLAKDADGLVPIDEVAEYLNISKEKMYRTLRFGERKRILINLVRDVENDRLILTDKYVKADFIVKDMPFIGMTCPGCAAQLKIRQGAVGNCPFCGREIIGR